MMKYIENSIELGQYVTEDFESITLKYQQERKYLNLIFFATDRKYKIYDKDTYQGYDTLTRGYKNIYATTKTDNIEKMISLSIRETLNIKSKPEGVSSSKQVSDLEAYQLEQSRYLEIETLQHFLTIINLLKQNSLESTTEIYQGKNIHELVREIEESLA